MLRYTRRRINRSGLGAATTGSLAGCSSSDVDSDGPIGDGPKAQSSLFVFGDFASQVVGDIATAETPQKAANQLVAETGATEVLSLTPIPGHTQGWAEKDWRDVKNMENVNLGTLKKALDAA